MWCAPSNVHRRLYPPCHGYSAADKSASALSQLEFGVPLALSVFFVAERSRQEFQNHWQSQWHTIPESSVDKALPHSATC